MVSPVPVEEVLGRLPADERRWVETFRDHVRAELGPRLRDLRLYGSKVRGDWHEESDIDLLVLIDSMTQGDWERVLSIGMEISYTLRPAPRDFDDYHAPKSRASGFYKEMRKESVRL